MTQATERAAGEFTASDRAATDRTARERGARERTASDRTARERGGHECPGLEPGTAARLAELLAAEPWVLRALDAVAVSGLPDAWIGAGVIRDAVWGSYHGGFDPAGVKDVDVAYFDPDDLTMERDLVAQETLGRLAELPWEATNQAAVHVWYHQYFGGPPVESFASVHDAVATWPETATCVAVRQRSDGLEVCAPHGLADLLEGVWRVNPIRVTPAISLARLARQRVRTRWPRVKVVPPGVTAPFPLGLAETCRVPPSDQRAGPLASGDGVLG
jgi:uncharacterized protein